MSDYKRGLHDVAAADDVRPGMKVIVEVGERSIGVFNVNGKYYAMNNLCPHAGAPLCKGYVTGTPSAMSPYEVGWHKDGEIIRCPWHSWEFEIATGRTVSNPRKSVRTYPVQIENGRIMVDLGAAR